NWTQNKELKDKERLLGEVRNASLSFVDTIEKELAYKKELRQEMKNSNHVKESFYHAIETKYGENPFRNIYNKETGDVINPKLEYYQDLMMEYDMLEVASDPALYTRDEMEINADTFSNEHEKDKQNKESNNIIKQTNQRSKHEKKKKKEK